MVSRSEYLLVLRNERDLMNHYSTVKGPNIVLRVDQSYP